MIHWIYLLVSGVSIFAGLTVGWWVGARVCELRRVKRVLRAKNPELWDLEHYATIEAEESQRRKAKRR